MDHLRHDTSVFKKLFPQLFLLTHACSSGPKFKVHFIAWLWPWGSSIVLQSLRRLNRITSEKQVFFLGLFTFGGRGAKTSLRLLEQTRIPTYTTVVKVQRVFAPNHRHLFFLQLQSARSRSVFGQLAVTFKAKKIETEKKSEETIPELG